MKKLKIYSLAVIAVLVLFTSCTNNDDDTNFATDVEGEWQLTSLESVNPYDFNNDGQPTNNVILETNCYLNETIVFNPDNTAVLKGSSYTEIIAMLVPGTTDQYNYAAGCINEERIITYSWSVDGNNIILINNLDARPEILSVQDKQFSFTTQDALIVRKAEGGTIFIEEDLKFTYTKE